MHSALALRPGRRDVNWFALFAITRLAAALVALLLLILQDLRPDEAVLGLVGFAYALLTIGLLARQPHAQRSLAFAAIDVVAVLALVVIYGQWRSPFYLFALTSLIMPVTSLAPRRALAFGGAFVVAYFGVALLVGVDWQAVATTARLESFVTHLLVPLLVTVALVFAAELLRNLQRERANSERLALEAERQRIAWELHDSAKQRIHAAHLLLSAATGGRNGAHRSHPTINMAMRELNAAVADMDTSLRDLREPLLDAGSLGEALREWATRLSEAADVDIEVVGDAPALPPFVAAHAYRVGREALTNVVRHADARHAEVVVKVTDDRLHLVVADDGCGMPDDIRPGAAGLRSMYGRAQALSGDLSVTAGFGGRGTVIALHAPLDSEMGVLR